MGRGFPAGDRATTGTDTPLLNPGVKVMEFDDSIWEAFGKAAKEAQDAEMGDDLFATIRGSYEASMASTYGWMGMSDGLYLQKRSKFLA